MNDDALVIAKWCWPETRWAMREDEGVAIDWGLVSFTREELAKSSGPVWNPLDPGHIADAERVLIERGHGGVYGLALCHALFDDGHTIPVQLDEDVHYWELYEPKDFAKLATAPLEARVRAMAAVIRSLA